MLTLSYERTWTAGKVKRQTCEIQAAKQVKYLLLLLLIKRVCFIIFIYFNHSFLLSKHKEHVLVDDINAVTRHCHLTWGQKGQKSFTLVGNVLIICQLHARVTSQTILGKGTGGNK